MRSRLRTVTMLKNPRPAAKPHRYSATGLSHPAKTLAVSRFHLQSAKRRARLPMSGFVFAQQARRRPLFERRDTQLPPRIFRPDIDEVQAEAVYTHMPELVGLPLNAIRKALGSGDPIMRGAVNQIPLYAEPPSAIIPKEMEVLVDNFSVATVPTHYLAVFQSTARYPYGPAARVTWQFSFRRNIKIYPIHSIIFVSHCSRFPVVPESDPVLTALGEGMPGSPQTSVKLPVIRLCVPHIKQFEIVMQYLYTYDWKQFAFNLIPVHPTPDIRDGDPMPGDPNAPFLHVWTVHHAKRLVYTVPPNKIVAMKEWIWAVYQNMIALGIADKKMWQVLCLSYDTVRLVEDLRRQRKLLFKLAPPPDLPTGSPEMHKVGSSHCRSPSKRQRR